VSDDIHAERRIHQLEEQLRNARDDALEEAAELALLFLTRPFSPMDPAYIAAAIRAKKGTQA